MEQENTATQRYCAECGDGDEKIIGTYETASGHRYALCSYCAARFMLDRVADYEAPRLTTYGDTKELQGA